MISRIIVLLTSLALFQSTLANERPNIVVIVADDLGWRDVSFHGGEIKTPNIDRIAKEGAELDRFYVCPVCSPTRAGLMTGRYPIRFGLMRAVIPPWRDFGLDTSEVTLPEVLAKAGYKHRGIFGKWHLGHSRIKYHPLRRGFTEFVGHYNGAIDYFTHEREGELDWHNGFDSNYDKGYSTDLIADAAVDFINRHAKSESPFFVYIPFNAPHGPFQAKQKDLDDYDHLAGNARRQALAAMISSLDQGIGRVLDALDKNKVANNTLVWFFSDNGGVAKIGDNRPLRGAKASVFEGGIRVAAAARWPNRIPASSKVAAPLAYIDVLPTVMSITGIKDHGGKPLDGLDATDALTGKTKTLDREIYSYIGQQGEDSEHITLIDSKWKLVINGQKITDRAADVRRDVLLFELTTDPFEKNNVAAEHPDEVARMTDKLKSFRNLQPKTGVPKYNAGRNAFQAPKEWKISQ